MKVKILTRPTGLLNGEEWPKVGETVDLPDSVAEDMVKAGHVEKVAAKKAAAKPEKAEKRPAAKADVETRKK